MCLIDCNISSFNTLSFFLISKMLPWWLRSKESTSNTGDRSSIPGVDPKEQKMAGRPPGEAMATHSSIPAWVIPWTEVAS